MKGASDYNSERENLQILSQCFIWFQSCTTQLKHDTHLILMTLLAIFMLITTYSFNHFHCNCWDSFKRQFSKKNTSAVRIFQTESIFVIKNQLTEIAEINHKDIINNITI